MHNKHTMELLLKEKHKAYTFLFTYVSSGRIYKNLVTGVASWEEKKGTEEK